MQLLLSLARFSVSLLVLIGFILVLDSGDLNPLANGLYSILSWVICYCKRSSNDNYFSLITFLFWISTAKTTCKMYLVVLICRYCDKLSFGKLKRMKVFPVQVMYIG